MVAEREENLTKSILKHIVATTPVTDYLDPHSYLGDLYQKAKYKLSTYSYLKFASDLGFAATNVLRLIIASERALTPKMGQRIGKALRLAGTASRYWTKLVAYGYERSSDKREKILRDLVSLKAQVRPKELSPTQARYFDQWYNPVIREMTGLPDFEGSAPWIQERLVFPLRLDEIRKSLEILELLGLIKKDPQTGSFIKVARVDTGANVDSVALVRYHQTMIDAGREAITRTHEDSREIEALTVSVPLSAVAEIKAKIAALTQEILALESFHAMHADAKKAPMEVFQLNVQLFPFTSKKGRGP